MPYTFEKAKVLLVDDMHAMLQLTKSILNVFGFREVHTASNGEEAYKIIKKVDPDLVITDWMMDPMDGVKLTEEIRKNPLSPNPYVPIIVMTGFSAKPRVINARDKGITEFMVKPFTSRDLYNKIVQVIERPRQFVDVEDFFGPDRRRKNKSDYGGPRRRIGEEEDDKNPKEQKLAAELLKKLRSDVQNVDK